MRCSKQNVRGGEYMFISNAEMIRKAMMNKGIGVTELAKKAKLSQGAISKITTSDRRCTIRTIGRISNALGVSVEQITIQA